MDELLNKGIAAAVFIWGRTRDFWHAVLLVWRGELPASPCKKCGKVAGRAVISQTDGNFKATGITNELWKCGECGFEWVIQNRPPSQ